MLDAGESYRTVAEILGTARPRSDCTTTAVLMSANGRAISGVLNGHRLPVVGQSGKVTPCSERRATSASACTTGSASAKQRTRQIGRRRALGASAASVPRMTTRVPQRLRPVLGADLGRVDRSRLEALVGYKEADDFEVKEKRYGNGDAEKRELATDVAALANARGGVLLIGARESNDVITELTPGPLAGEGLRIHQIIANLIVPPLAVKIHEVADQNGEGFLLVSVPASERAPHAVMKDDDLRFVVRDGPRKRRMGESEVADRYRTRFLNAEGQLTRSSSIHESILGLLDQSQEAAWLVMSATPSGAGNLPISKSERDLTGPWLESRAILSPYPEMLRYFSQFVTTGTRRFVAREADERDEGEKLARYAIAHLFSDGASGFGFRVGHQWWRSEGSDTVTVGDEGLAWNVISGLLLLGGHAERCAASGELTVVSSLESAHPIQLGQNRSGTRALGYRRTPDELERLSRSVVLDDIMNPGPNLVGVAALIVAELHQGFGHPESLQLTPAGEIDWQYVNRDYRPYIGRWCDTYGVTVLHRS